MPIRLTSAGMKHIPIARHHFGAWGGIKELLRANGGTATREEILEVLEYCGHWDEKFQPNTDYVKHALKSGWLEEC